MAYDGSRYEKIYRKLVSLYPRHFRERVGESMEQTFRDLCRERLGAGEGLLGFAVWTYADTVLGIIREGINYMTPGFKTHGQIIFALIGALAIVGSAWWTRGTENTDTWLYVFSIWMILFSAFEIYSSVKAARLSRIALASLIGAFAIIVVAWWANGAEHARVFLTCTVGMVVSFFAIVSPLKKDKGQ